MSLQGGGGGQEAKNYLSLLQRDDMGFILVCCSNICSTGKCNLTMKKLFPRVCYSFKDNQHFVSDWPITVDLAA